MKERWNSSQKKYVASPEIDAFLAEIAEVCARHKMWLGHEDVQGSFLIVAENTDDWLSEASDSRETF